MPKTKSRAQVGLLLSRKVSPLSEEQRAKLKRELHSGAVKVSKRYHALPKHRRMKS
jgi:hypothetical protein